MQKVVGSSPSIRFKKPAEAGLLLLMVTLRVPDVSQMVPLRFHYIQIPKRSTGPRTSWCGPWRVAPSITRVRRGARDGW
jgi:hypothetical protein